MSDSVLERLDLTSPEARAEFERAFYSAFVQVAGNRLIRQLWVWNETEGRIATRVPYDDQVIYVFRDACGAIATAMAVNVKLHEFQSAAYGFPGPVDRRGCCELLALFVVAGHDLHNAYHFRAASFDDLYRRGFNTAYATTATRVLRFYLRLGAEQLDEHMVQDERRHFLQFDLRRAALRRRPG